MDFVQYNQFKRWRKRWHMNSIDKIVDLLAHTSAQKITYVFPSEVVARSYLEACARKYPNKAIFNDLVISWDTFSEKFTQYPKNLTRAVFTDRLLFVQHFFKSCNAMQRLKYYCDSSYLCSKPAYMRSIAKALPKMCKAFDLNTMQILDKVLQDSSKEMLDDLRLLVPSYKDYLEQHGLYDMAFYEPNFTIVANDGSLARDYTLVFPQIFSKTGILKALEGCKSVDLPLQEEGLKLKLFTNSLAEIRACMRKIYTLLSTGTPPNDIAISCADFDAYKPYLNQEAQKRDITLTFNNALPLSTYTPGAFFCALLRVKGENYSFNSMKALLLDLQYPYKDRETLVSIIQKAVDCKCKDGPLSNWVNKFKKLGALKEAQRLSEIDTAIRAVVDCKDPLKLKENVMILIKDLFGENSWTNKEEQNDSLKAENARIFGSCERELDNLSSHASEVDLDASGSFFSLFTDILRDNTYRPNTGRDNINVYNYPVSAGLAVKYHFILGLTESTSKVLRNPYPFLPLDKAKTMDDVVDLEESVINLYSQTIDGCYSWMSSAEEGFSGSDVVPTIFLKANRLNRIKDVELDSFAKEIKVWEGQDSPKGEVFEITQKQKDCFNWAYGCELNFDNELVFMPVQTPLKISVSSVKEFESCPYKGYAYCVLGLKNVDFEPNMADAAQIGNLLHSTLQLAIKEAGSIEAIKTERLQEIFKQEVAKYEKLARSTDSVHLQYIRNKYSKILPLILDCVEETEKTKENTDAATQVRLGTMNFKAMEYTSCALDVGPIRFEGRMDCILEDSNGSLAVIDLKKDASKHHGSSLDKVNLQVAIYSKMLEKDPNFGKRPEIGAFYSFEDGKFYFVWPKFGKRKDLKNFFYNESCLIPDAKGGTDEYVEENYNKRVSQLAKIVEDHNFAPNPANGACDNCPFFNLCRGGFQTV